MSICPPRRVFIATPGDVEGVRARVMNLIDSHTQPGTQAPFKAVGWEGTLGGARRPQEVINEELWKCHFLVVIFRKSWGSATGSRWGYTSGTEEELFTGLLALHDRQAPMRDVWVVFFEEPRVDSRISRLREQLEQNSSLYFQTVSNDNELIDYLQQKLHIWASDDGAKDSFTVSLTPSSGMEILKADIARRDGLELADLDFKDLAEEKLAEAANFGEPRAMLDFARFLARQRRFDEALKWNEKVIEMQAAIGGGVHSAEAAEAYSNLVACR